MARKYSRKASAKVGRAMRKRKAGTLKSGRSGKTVKSRKQAIAIGLSEARKEGKKVPPKKKAAKKKTTKKKTAKRKSAKRTAKRRLRVKRKAARRHASRADSHHAIASADLGEAKDRRPSRPFGVWR